MTKPITKNNAAIRPLLPALFDRLRDDHPTQLSELPSAYTLTPTTLHEIIRRDLGFLLNTANLHGAFDFTGYPEAEKSCINFGVPPLIGISTEAERKHQLDAFVREAIRRFEPRLIPQTMSIHMPDRHKGVAHMPAFEIRAEIDAQPYPLAFTARSALDFESGRLAELKPA